KSGTTKISIKYSSSTDITLEVRSLLWSSIVSTSISSNAIQGSLSKIETQPWGEAVGGFLLFAKGVDMRAEITISYIAPDGGVIDWLLDPPSVTSGFDVITIDKYDINPIHKIREILIDDTAMGKPESDVDR